MSDREFDAEVAEKVMGIRWIVIESAMINGRLQGNGDVWWPEEFGDPLNPSSGAHVGWGPDRYSTDPSADYEVLKHVRETWGDDIHEFCRHLYLILRQNMEAVLDYSNEIDYAAYYLCGDYSRAALAVANGDKP